MSLHECSRNKEETSQLSASIPSLPVSSQILETFFIRPLGSWKMTRLTACVWLNISAQ